MISLGADHGIAATILGCGSSGGVPRLGNNWGACDPKEPRNQRRRCSLLVERDATRVLVDTSPDMRQQLLDAEVGHLDAVLYTHDHADQTHGIDDLRMICYNMRKRVPVYMDAATRNGMMERFGYCFEQEGESYYPAILEAREISPALDGFKVEGEGGPLAVQPFLQNHGNIDSLGFRFGPVAYSADVVGLPEESFAALEGVSCWIVDCLRYEKHISHAHLDLTLSWLDRVKPKLGILTNLHVDLDYQTLRNELPEGVIPAYDMLKVSF